MEQYLKPKEVAQMLGVSEIYLAKMRNSKYNTEKDGTLKKSFFMSKKQQKNGLKQSKKKV